MHEHIYITEKKKFSSSILHDFMALGTQMQCTTPWEFLFVHRDDGPFEIWETLEPLQGEIAYFGEVCVAEADNGEEEIGVMWQDIPYKMIQEDGVLGHMTLQWDNDVYFLKSEEKKYTYQMDSK